MNEMMFYLEERKTHYVWGVGQQTARVDGLAGGFILLARKGI